MKTTFDQKLISSFLLFIDHTLLDKGQAYINYSGRFYSVPTPYNGLYAYAAPFRQLVFDQGITGATQFSGIYLNNNFVTIGQSGLQSINHPDGTIYFNSQLPTNTVLSGDYSVKEFNTQISDLWEMRLIFDTKYEINARTSQNLSGLSSDTKTAPAIFIRYKDTENKGFAFGGIDDNSLKLRLIAICNTEFQKIGVCNIFKNLNFSGIPYITGTLPFSFKGDWTGTPYNYNNLPFDTTYSPFIKEVRAYDVPQAGEYANINRSMAILDFEIFTAMRHNT